MMALATLSCLLPGTARADDTGSDQRVVRVGYYPMTNFQEYDASTGEYRGYSYDYMLAIAQYAGWKYEFVPVTYDEGIQMLENGELDLMNNVEMSDALSSSLSFSTLSSGESCTCLVVPPSTTDVAYEDFDAFSGLTVGLDYSSNRNSGFIDYCKDNDCMPQLIYYHTQSGVEQGMESGEIDAYLVSNLQDVDMRTVAKFDTTSYYFATTKGNSDLLKELDTAMNALKTNDPYFEEKIYAKYHTRSADETTVISSDEQAYINEQPSIRVAYDPSWYPISYTGDDGGFDGAMATVFQNIADRTGLRFEYVPTDTYEEALQSLADGDVQVMAGFPYDYTWAAKYNCQVTDPFTTLTVFSAYRNGNGSGDAVAVSSDSYLEYLSSEIRQEDYQFQEYQDTDACLKAVLNGNADYAFLDSDQVEYYRERSEYRNLSYKVANEDGYRLSIAVSYSSDPRLYSILNKSLSSLGTDQIDNIFRENSVSTRSRSLVDALYSNPRVAGIFFVILGFLAAVLIGGWVYMRNMREKNRQLKVATNAKSEFMSNISHDMRTPLNGIIGYTDLAISSDDETKRADYLDKIRISGQFLLSLINDTLDISKIESGKYLLSPESISSDDLVNSIVVPIRQMADEKGVAFHVDVSHARRGYVLVDPLSVQKIILNLLSNAVKFTPVGGSVHFRIEELDPAIDGLNMRMVVEDDGIGIDEKFLSEAFEPFSQEHDPNAKETVGTGLGLSIVDRLVKLMGGRIEVTSEKGKGTRFEVYLPIEYLGDYHPANLAVEDADRTLEGCRALLCEDNAFNREIATTILGSFGMEVDEAPDGKSGLEVFATSSDGYYDVILMDLRMPVMDGYGSARAIRALRRADSATVPIIALSADAYEEDIQQCRDAGMDGHVAKPIDRTALRHELLKLCGKERDRT